MRGLRELGALAASVAVWGAGTALVLGAGLVGLADVYQLADWTCRTIEGERTWPDGDEG